MSQLKLIISEKATDDLVDIWSYIALDNPNVADLFIDKLYESCLSLTLMPEMGRKRDELLPGIRSLPFKGYIIFYRIGKGEIQIARILNGVMDIETMF